MVPRFKIRWLPKLLRHRQTDGVLPHGTMRSRNGVGARTISNVVYSERFVTIIVDFGAWVPRQTKLVPGLQVQLARGRRSAPAAPPPRTRVPLAEPHPDPSLAKDMIGIVPADHSLRTAPYPPPYLCGGQEEDDDDANNANNANNPNAHNPLLAGDPQRPRRQRNLRKHWLRHDAPTFSQRAPLHADKAFVRVSTNKYFEGRPLMYATLVDAETLEEVVSMDKVKPALSAQRPTGCGGRTFSRRRDRMVEQWPAARDHKEHNPGVHFFTAPEHITNAKDEDADVIGKLPAKMTCNVTPPKRARSQESAGRRYKIAVHIRGELRTGDMFETTVYTDGPFESLARKKVALNRCV